MLEIPELASGNPQLQKAMTKIVKVEQKALDKFDEKKGLVDNKLKLVSDLKEKFSEVKDSLMPFKTVNDFKDLKGISSNPNVLNVGAVDKAKAQAGSYDIEVLNLANTNSVMTYGFPDRDQSEVGVGYVSFTTPNGEKRDVYINSDNNTLDGVARTINQAGVGVRATVVNDGTDAEEPWRLVISGEKTGWKSDYQWAEFHMLDGDMDLDLERTRDAKSAIIRFNGHPIMCDENTVKDLLPGVTLDLKNAKPGEIVKVEVRPDIEKIHEKAKNFVDKMNAVLTFFQQQAAVNQDSRKDPAKALSGDSSLQAIQSRMRVLIQDSQNELGSSEVQGLRDVGIVFNRSGTLDFDEKKFQARLDSNFEDVAALLSGTGPLGGFAARMMDLVDGVTRRGDGMMTIRETNLRDNVKQLEDQKEKKTVAAEARLERIKQQFARAESAIAQMQSQSPVAGMAGGGG